GLADAGPQSAPGRGPARRDVPSPQAAKSLPAQAGPPACALPIRAARHEEQRRAARSDPRSASDSIPDDGSAPRSTPPRPNDTAPATGTLSVERSRTPRTAPSGSIRLGAQLPQTESVAQKLPNSSTPSPNSLTQTERPKCKGCPETICKGCHATEQFQPPEREQINGAFRPGPLPLFRNRPQVQL